MDQRVRRGGGVGGLLQVAEHLLLSNFLKVV